MDITCPPIYGGLTEYGSPWYDDGVGKAVAAAPGDGSLVAQRNGTSSFRGLQPPFERAIYPDSRCALPQRLSFFCSWPRRLSAAPGCTYIGGCGYRAPGCPGSCRIGEVWTSPRRESPRLPGCSQHPGGTSSPKADGLYKSCWRNAAPLGRPFTAESRPGAHRSNGGSADLVTVPAPGRQQGRARFKGPPMLPSPHQITSRGNDTLTPWIHRKGPFLTGNGPKTPQKTGVHI